MGVEIRKVFVATDMVPMDMGRHGGDRLVGQLSHFVIDVADAEAGVDEECSIRAPEQITMRFFPMPVFAYDMGIPVYVVYCEPITHLMYPFT
jgi:hypothetical protein